MQAVEGGSPTYIRTVYLIGASRWARLVYCSGFIQREREMLGIGQGVCYSQHALKPMLQG